MHTALRQRPVDPDRRPIPCDPSPRAAVASFVAPAVCPGPTIRPAGAGLGWLRVA
jgi:hypothetical protein